MGHHPLHHPPESTNFSDEIFIAEADNKGWIKFGFIETNPDTLKRDVDEYPRVRGEMLGSYELKITPTQSRREGYVIYTDDAAEYILIGSMCGKSREPRGGLRATEPMYVYFVFSGIHSSLTIIGNAGLELVRELQDLRDQQIPLITPRTSVVQLRAKYAESEDDRPSRANSVFIKTSLGPGHALIVVLSELKRKKPVRIFLTTMNADLAYSYDSLEQLSQTSCSIKLESEIPEALDLLGVWISPNGGVYISHGLCEWFKRTEVHPNREYDAIFAMENIHYLRPVGKVKMTVDFDDHESILQVCQPKPLKNGPPECIVCFVKQRDFVLLPCLHYALCASCASDLRKYGYTCPVCREEIVDARKLHIP